MRNRLSFLAAIATALVLAQHCHAQAIDFPSKPIKLVVPVAPGGTSDIVARAIARDMGDYLKQPVIIDNKPGATGLVGSKLVQQSRPDGYTLLFTGVSTLVTNALLRSPIPFDAVRDFSPIGRAVQYPLFILASSGVQAKTLQQLVSDARSKPVGIFQASSGTGSVAHLACESFAGASGVNIQHVPYNSTRAAQLALATNEAQIACLSEEGVEPFVAAGKIRRLAVLSDKRVTEFPDIPTAEEAGYPGLVSNIWLGMFAPAGTPDAVIQRLSNALQHSLRTPEFIELARRQLMDPMLESPSQASNAIRMDKERWAKVIKSKNITFTD